MAELSNALCDDHEVHLFAAEIDDVRRDKVTLHPVPVPMRPLAIKFLMFYQRSSAMIDFDNFDIVHSVGAITARQNVMTMPYCQYAWGDVIRRDRGKNHLTSPYHDFMWRYTGAFERRAVLSQNTCRIGAVSHRIGQELVEFYGCNPTKIKTIYNGIDPDRFHPRNATYRSEIRQRYGILDTNFVILFVGEYRRKGLISLLRAVAEFNCPNAKLLAIGQGKSDEYRLVARDLKIEQQVVFAPPTNDIEKVFGACDVFAFPTFYEPFGMVITEAMSSGLPTIIPKTAGAAELIEHGKNGMLIESAESTSEMAAHLRALKDNPEMRASVGALGRSSVQGYDWRFVAAETMKMYEDVLGGTS